MTPGGNECVNTQGVLLAYAQCSRVYSHDFDLGLNDKVV